MDNCRLIDLFIEIKNKIIHNKHYKSRSIKNKTNNERTPIFRCKNGGSSNLTPLMVISMGGFFMASKGPIFNKFNDEFKKTSYNKFKSVAEYQVLVEDWIEFYNTKR